MDYMGASQSELNKLNKEIQHVERKIANQSLIEYRFECLKKAFNELSKDLRSPHKTLANLKQQRAEQFPEYHQEVRYWASDIQKVKKDGAGSEVSESRSACGAI